MDGKNKVQLYYHSQNVVISTALSKFIGFFMWVTFRNLHRKPLTVRLNSKLFSERKLHMIEPLKS